MEFGQEDKQSYELSFQILQKVIAKLLKIKKIEPYWAVFGPFWSETCELELSLILNRPPRKIPYELSLQTK